MIRETLTELLARQRALTIFALVLLALMIPVTIVQDIDSRTLDGVDVWAKPDKFLLSIAVFALTSAWSFGYVRPERRTALTMRALVVVLIVAASVEQSYITWQAAHGIASHFNRSTLFYGVMYGIMGVGAILLVGTTLPLAWEIARRPVPGLRPDYRAAVVIGLVQCFVIGGGLGFFMAQGTGHTVGVIGGHAPLFGWNRCGGDLRIAHFLGIHAQQAIPLLAILVAGLPPRSRWAAVGAGSVVYAAITIALFAQAMAGQPLPLGAAPACATAPAPH